LLPLIEAVTVTKPAGDWVETLQAAGVPAALLQDYGQVFSDPHLLERNFFVDVPHTKAGPVRVLGSAMRFLGDPDAHRAGRPAAGRAHLRGAARARNDGG